MQGTIWPASIAVACASSLMLFLLAGLRSQMLAPRHTDQRRPNATGKIWRR